VKLKKMDAKMWEIKKIERIKEACIDNLWDRRPTKLDSADESLQTTFGRLLVGTLRPAWRNARRDHQVKSVL